MMMDTLLTVHGMGKSTPLEAFIYAKLTWCFRVSYNCHYV